MKKYLLITICLAILLGGLLPAQEPVQSKPQAMTQRPEIRLAQLQQEYKTAVAAEDWKKAMPHWPHSFKSSPNTFS